MEYIFNLDFLKLASVLFGIPIVLIVWKRKDFKYFFQKLDRFDITFLIVHLFVAWGFLTLLVLEDKGIRTLSKISEYIYVYIGPLLVIAIWYLFSKIIEKQEMSFRFDGQEFRIIGGALSFTTVIIEGFSFFLLTQIIF